jgi:hypothetical protein
MTEAPVLGARQPRTRPPTSSRQGALLGSLLWVIAGVLVTAPAARAQPAPTERVVVRLDAGWRPASRTFADTRAFTANLEQGQFAADYELKDGGVFDGGVSFLLWRNLAIGLDVSSFRTVHDARINSEVPHPFFFDLPRTTEGRAGGLERREVGIHIRAMWVSQVTDWLVVSVFAGPSIISATQDLVSAVQHTEIAFPFSEVTFSGHTVSARKETTTGLNGGVDIDSFFLHRLPFLGDFEVMEHIGVGLLVRYVRGTAILPVDNDPIEVDLGGLQITSGVRFRF